MAALAEERLREANEAYEFLTRQMEGKETGGPRGFRGAKSQGYGNGAYSGYNAGNPGQGQFAAVRMAINRGDFVTAENMLSGMDNNHAEWHYLMGVVFLRKGWYNEANQQIQMAVNMDPGNMEYRDTLNRMSGNFNAYRTDAFGRGYGRGPDMCSTCQCLICSDCCCEAMGGDLIGCC